LNYLKELYSQKTEGNENGEFCETFEKENGMNGYIHVLLE
jgi:hypothetical protein